MKQTPTTLGAFRSADIATIPIASGVLTITSAMVIAQAESGTADDIATITPDIESINATDRYFILIEADSGDTITLKHGTGNLSFVNATDIVLASGERALLFGSATLGFDDIAISAGASGGMTDFTLAGDSGTPETVGDGNTVSILGGDGITTVVSATDTVTAAVDNTVIRTTGTQSIGAGLTVTSPTIADFTNMAHDHLDADDGGTLSASAIASGTLLHERGGLEADVSAYSGLLKISGGATSQAVANTDYAAATHASRHEGGGADALNGDAIEASYSAANYTPASSTIGGHLEGIDDALGAGGGGSDSFATLVDSKANGTAGGATAATTWNQRTFTEGTDADGLITVSSNQVTPIANTYRIQIWALVYKSTAQKLRFYNVTGAAVVAYGLNARSGNGDDSATMCYLECEFTANGTDAYRIDHYTQVAQATNGLGVQLNVGFTEDYMYARITKLT
jgi:hypothetical protein